MHIEPPAGDFAATYARGAAQVVWTTLVADLETPVSAFLKTGADKPLSFLFESVEGGAARGRYSIIGLDPDAVWRARGDTAEINRNARQSSGAFLPCNEPPLTALRAFINESRFALPEGLPPMAAGVFGYLSYDMVRLMEELPRPNPDPIGIPDAILVRPTVILIFDSVQDTLTIVTPVRPVEGVIADAALARAVDRLTAVMDALDKPHKSPIPRRSNSAPWWHGQRTTLAPAIFSRSFWRSASRRRSRCRRSRSIGRCAGSIRRRSCSISAIADFPWSDRAPRSWCACAATR
jgi:anthranilate synthase component 1